MSLIPQAVINAAEIDRLNRELIGVMRHMLAVSYNRVMEDPQGVLEALGPNAKTALIRYAVLQGALKTIGESGDLVDPNFEIFQPQEDGRVLYVAPVEPVVADETP
jgi:hypothetical protein